MATSQTSPSLKQPNKIKTSLQSLKTFNIRLKASFQTLQFLLSQLTRCASVDHLRRFHAKILKTQFAKDAFLLTRLAHAYLLLEDVMRAKRILLKVVKKPPIFLWNETIKGFSRNGFFRESIDLYYTMTAGCSGSSVRPNEFTFTFVLPACAGARSAADGRKIHKDAVRWNCDSNVFVATALVDMYGKCGEIGVARQMFDRMPTKRTATYNAMISGYVMNGECDEAMHTFNQMQRSGTKADTVTMVSVLQACASLGALQQGRWVHEQVVRTKMDINVYLGAALIHMYARCGSIEESQRVFDDMPHRDLVCWTAIISGHGMHGHAEVAESLFVHMVQAGIRPDAVTFVGVLSGFSHGGMVDKGWWYFKKMSEEYNLNPGLEHYSCMVDMLGRAGRLEDAEQLVRTMPVEPDAALWGGLLNACKVHRNSELGERVLREVLKLDPYNAGWYVLMSNIFATEKKWDGVARMRLMMKERKLMKPPGWSSIEVGGQLHNFTVFDRSHPRSEEIYGVLKDLEDKMRLAGYVPETSCILGNLGEDMKEDLLCGHSERLAIAFGILATEEGELLRIMKNLRVCMDCHTATKFISKIAKRDIIVRDANRFHHFRGGVCSCGDYW